MCTDDFNNFSRPQTFSSLLFLGHAGVQCVRTGFFNSVEFHLTLANLALITE